MARRFAKVSEEEIVAINEVALFYPSDLLKSGGYIPRVSVNIHHYSPPLRGIVVFYCYTQRCKF